MVGRWILRALHAVVATALIAGCTAAAQPAGGPLRVVTTTTLLASLAGDVGRGRATVTSLMPVGASPETYQPTPADIVRASRRRADRRERRRAWKRGSPRCCAPAARPTRRVVDCSAGLHGRRREPALVARSANTPRHYVARDSRRHDRRRSGRRGRVSRQCGRARRADRALARASARASRRSRRPTASMIVFHNAWLYYNRRFGLRTLGSIEEVPGSEPSAEHLAHLIDAARAAHVRAIFAEPEYNAQLGQRGRAQRGHSRTSPCCTTIRSEPRRKRATTSRCSNTDTDDDRASRCSDADALTAPFQYDFMQRAFVTALLVGGLCSTLGTYVVLRKLSFIGDGVAHASFAGIVIAYIRGLNFEFGAAVVAVITALGHRLHQPPRPRLAGHGDRRALHRRLRARRLPDEPRAHVDRRSRKTFCSATSWASARPICGSTWAWPPSSPSRSPGTTARCCSRRSIRRSLARVGLPVVFIDNMLLVLLALTIVISLESIGIILVAALLVTPAAAAAQVTRRFVPMMLTSAAIGDRQLPRRPLHLVLRRRGQRRHDRAGRDRGVLRLAGRGRCVAGPRSPGRRPKQAE